MPGEDGKDNLAPGELAHLKLTRNMDEKCQLLREYFFGKFYQSLEEYDGHGFLKAWDEHIEVNGFLSFSLS